MVTLHIMTMCGKGDVDWWREVMQWSYFFMSFFFFKAGYFNKGVTGRTLPYLRDRVKRLLIPWATCGLLGNAVYFAFLPKLVERYHKPIEPLEWEHIWETSSHYGNSPTWFLFSFFVAYVVAHFLEKVPRLHWVVLLFPLVSIALWQAGNPLWLSLNNVFMGVSFFYLDRIWSWLMQNVGSRRMLWLSVALVAGFVAVNFVWRGYYTMSSNTFNHENPAESLAATVLALTGIAGVLLCLRVPRVPVFNFIGEHSMVYFTLHYPMLYFYKFTHLSFGRSIYGRWDDVVILVPVVFGLCTWLVPYFESCPWLSGRWRQESESRNCSAHQSCHF